MENASKALLIAGAVLIVILLIAFAMNILNSTKEPMDGVKETMTVAEKATFNNKFTAYAGSRKSSAQAKSLANTVVAHNSQQEDAKKVKVIIGGTTYTTAKDITNKTADIIKNVKIEVDDTNSDGLIDTITITEL